MEQFKMPQRAESEEHKPENKIEKGEHARTMVAAAMFLGAMAADPALAQDQNSTEVAGPAMQQHVDPGAILNNFIRNVQDDLRKKGVDKEVLDAASQFLQTVTDKGADALRQGASQLDAVHEDIRKQREGQ